MCIILPRVDHFDEAIKEMTPAGFPIVYSMECRECDEAIEIMDVFFALVASAIPGYVFLSKLFSVELSVERWGKDLTCSTTLSSLP